MRVIKAESSAHGRGTQSESKYGVVSYGVRRRASDVSGPIIALMVLNRTDSKFHDELNKKRSSYHLGFYPRSNSAIADMYAV